MKHGVILCTMAILAACGGEDPPDPVPPGGFQILAPTLVAEGADTYPVAIDPHALKVSYTSDDLLFVRDLQKRTTLASGEKLDRRFAPLFEPDWSRAAFVRAFDDNEDYELAAADLATSEKIELTTNGRTTLVRSGDRSQILYLSQGSGIPELWAYDPATKTKKMLAARANRFHVVDASTKVVYTVPGELHVVDVATNSDERISDLQSLAYAGPGASKLLFYSAPQTIVLFDVLTTQLSTLATDASEEPGNAEISADQTRAIFAREEVTGRALYMVDTANPIPEKIFAYTEQAHLSRDGRSVLLWTYNGPANLFLWTASGGDPQLISRYFVPSGGPRHDPDLKHIAYFARPETAYELHFYDAVAKRDTMIHGLADPANMRLASDGSRVTFYTGDDATYGPLVVWDRASGMNTWISNRATRQLATKQDLSAIAFSEPPTAERISLWTAGSAQAAVIAEHGDLSKVWLDPGERRIAFASGADLWLDVLGDTTPPKLFARRAGDAAVMAESLIAYSVRAGTSTASGVYIAPLP